MVRQVIEIPPVASSKFITLFPVSRANSPYSSVNWRASITRKNFVNATTNGTSLRLMVPHHPYQSGKVQVLEAHLQIHLRLHHCSSNWTQKNIVCRRNHQRLIRYQWVFNPLIPPSFCSVWSHFQCEKAESVDAPTTATLRLKLCYLFLES